MGYATVREVARDVISEQMALDSQLLPWRDRPAFQRRVLQVQLQREAAVADRVAFLDRGIPDGIAYLSVGGYELFPELPEQSHGRYAGVFLLEPVTGYEPDDVRTEDAVTARALHRELGAVYRELGYEVVKVPAMPVPDRARFVVQCVDTRTLGAGISATSPHS